MKKVCFAFVGIFFCSALCFSYTRITSSSGLTARWASMPIDYWTSKSGYSRIYNGSDVHQIREGFQKWQDVSTAAVSFNYRGVAQTDTAAIDGINLVTFNDSATPLGTSAIAVTLLVMEAGEQNAIIREADIVFSSSYTFRTYWQGEGGHYDVQHIALHEIGHFLGLDHTPILAATMAPYGLSDNTDRNLKRDDVVGISEIYPSGASGYGRIQGVASVDGQPRFGVHVAALDGSGRTVVSALTGRDGRYSLGLLQPGSYRIYAEPLDEPFTENELGGSYYSGLVVNDFRTTFFGNTGTLSTATPVTVSADSAATANIALLPPGNPSLNLQAPAILQRISPNETYNMDVAGADLTTGALFSSSVSGLTIGAWFGTTDGYPSAARVSVARGSNAPVGPADLIVTRGANTSIASGMLLVTDVLPTISQVSPSTGSAAGNERILITGTNFREGARVYFSGIPSADVRVLSSTVLDVLTPASREGYTALDVMNTDGTSAFDDRAFRFFIPPPVITSFSPASGAPGSLITIRGTNLLGYLGIVRVYFAEQHSAEVLFASPTEVRAVVPFFTSCECTISVYLPESRFSNSVGPFMVTGASPSSNRAVNEYNPTEAAAGATTLSFSSSTSAKAIATLPFDFVLFRDLFPAGSPLAITTNGYATFDSEAPVRSGYLWGEFPHTPTNIISPFLAPLELMPGLSSISTSVVGAAPNRRFIIHWSRMAALSGVTRDGCPFTFQAVLFEGSYDIQYAFEALGCYPRISRVTPTEIGFYSRSGILPIPFSRDATYMGQTFAARFSRTYTFANGTYTMSSKQDYGSIQVVDGGEVTVSTSELSAAWYWSAYGHLATYRYAVGRTPGAEDVVPFTATTATNVTVKNLSLTPGATYYFTVHGTLITTQVPVTGTGTSDGIRVENSQSVPARVVAFAPEGNGRFTGIALKASSATSVMLRAVDGTGQERGTTSLQLAAGQQYARLISELFGLETFDGWVEIQSSDLGLKVYVNTGYLDGRNSDGAVLAENMRDFVALHAGWDLYLVNPSPRQASVTLRSVAGTSEITRSIPPRGRTRVPLPWAAKVTSSEPLAAIEVLEQPGRLSLSMPESAETRSSLLFAHGVIGQDYVSALTLVNSGATETTARVSFGGQTVAVGLPANSVREVSLSDISQAAARQLLIDAVRVALDPPAQVAGVVDIQNSNNSIAMASGIMSKEFEFGHVAAGSGWFTGICLVSGNAETMVIIDVIDPNGRVVSTGEYLLAPNRQVARLIDELGAWAWNQMGGHIRIRSEQPILAWVVFGTQDAFSSSPPLR